MCVCCVLWLWTFYITRAARKTATGQHTFPAVFYGLSMNVNVSESGRLSVCVCLSVFVLQLCWSRYEWNYSLPISLRQLMQHFHWATFFFRFSATIYTVCIHVCMYVCVYEYLFPSICMILSCGHMENIKGLGDMFILFIDLYRCVSVNDHLCLELSCQSTSYNIIINLQGCVRQMGGMRVVMHVLNIIYNLIYIIYILLVSNNVPFEWRCFFYRLL